MSREKDKIAERMIENYEDFFLVAKAQVRAFAGTLGSPFGFMVVSQCPIDLSTHGIEYLKYAMPADFQVIFQGHAKELMDAIFSSPAIIEKGGDSRFLYNVFSYIVDGARISRINRFVYFFEVYRAQELLRRALLAKTTDEATLCLTWQAAPRPELTELLTSLYLNPITDTFEVLCKHFGLNKDSRQSGIDTTPDF